jgi:hypothetical protein
MARPPRTRVYSQRPGETEDEMLARASAVLTADQMAGFYAVYRYDAPSSASVLVETGPRLDPLADRVLELEAETGKPHVVMSLQGDHPIVFATELSQSLCDALPDQDADVLVVGPADPPERRPEVAGPWDLRYWVSARDPDLVERDLALCRKVAELCPEPAMPLGRPYKPGEWSALTQEERDASNARWEAHREELARVTGREWPTPIARPDDLGFDEAAWESARRHGFGLNNCDPSTDAERELWRVVQALRPPFSDGDERGGWADPRPLLAEVVRMFDAGVAAQDLPSVTIQMRREGDRLDAGWRMPLTLLTAPALEALKAHWVGGPLPDIYERVLDWHGPVVIESPDGATVYTAPDDLKPGTPEAFEHEVALLRTLPQDALIFSFEGESFCTVAEEVAGLSDAAERRRHVSWAEEVGGMIRAAMDDAGITAEPDDGDR